MAAARRLHVALAPALAALALAGACSGASTATEPLPPPPSTSALAPTTAAVDYSGVALPGVATGRTTTTALPLGPGRASLSGRVVAPDGAAVEGATVRVERLSGAAVATMDLLSVADGAWTVPGILGGRYRIRAWRQPDLALTQPALVFLGASQEGAVELKLEKHFGTTPLPSVSPLKPLVGQPTNLVLQLSTRSVDTAGVVVGAPVAGATVELAGGSGWTVALANPTTTDGAGRARWQLVCMAPGAQPMRLVVNGIEQFHLALPACGEPPPPSTTTLPGSTVAGTPTTRPAVTTTRPPATTTTTAPPPTTRPKRP